MIGYHLIDINKFWEKLAKIYPYLSFHIGSPFDAYTGFAPDGNKTKNVI